MTGAPTRRPAAATAAAAGLVVLYLLPAVWVTWPLALRIGTELPNPGGAVFLDVLFGGWLLAWESHALLTDPASLPQANIFHPAGGALFYGPTGFPALPFFLPTYLLAGNVVLALNVVLLAGLATTAAGVHAVVARWTGSTAAALVAGATFLGAPWTGTLAAAPYYAANAALPWLVFLAATASPGRGTLAAGAVLAAVQMLVDPVLGPVAVAAPLAAIAALRLGRRRTRQAGLVTLVQLGVACALAAPVYAGYAIAVARAPGPLESAADLSGLSPEALARVDALLAPTLASVVPPDLAWVPLLVVAAGWLAARGRGAARGPWRHALLWTGIGLLGLVPKVAFLWGAGAMIAAGQLLGPLRSIGRVYVDAAVGSSLLIGLAVAALAQRASAGRPRPRLAAALVAAAVAASIGVERRRWWPSPLVTAPPPAVPPSLLATLAGGGGPLLELPARWPGQHAVAMYRSSRHWRPLVNGYSSFWPPGFRARLALIDRLPEREALQALVGQTGLELVLVRLRELPGESRAAWTDVGRLLDAGLVRVGQGGDDVLFRVLAAPAGNPTRDAHP